MMPTVYLIVTVTMDSPNITVAVVLAISIQMMAFNQRVGHEKEPTGFAFSLLRFQ